MNFKFSIENLVNAGSVHAVKWDDRFQMPPRKVWWNSEHEELTVVSLQTDQFKIFITIKQEQDQETKNPTRRKLPGYH